MKLSLPKPSKTSFAVTITVSLIVGIGATAITYYSLKDKLVTETPQVNNEPLPQGVSAPVSLEDKIPAGTVSPTSIFAKPGDYIGKEVKVRGRIIKSQDKYIIVGQEVKTPRAIVITFEGSNIDPKQYISGYSNADESTSNQATAGAVTAIGKITQENAELKLVVKSIEK